MNEAKAREILSGYQLGEDGLSSEGTFSYLFWDSSNNTATLDGRFTSDELEAIAWWMKNKSK